MENIRLDRLISVPMTSDNWSISYTGGGEVRFDAFSHELTMQPKVPGSSQETFASLVLLKAKPLENYVVRLEVSTLAQLRTESPNSWEVFWFFGNYRPTSDGKKEANYFILKPQSGVELGTVFDEVGQSFVKTASEPTLQLGEKIELIIIKRPNVFRVYRDRVIVMDYLQESGGPQLYSHPGLLGLYSEDALVRVHAFSYLPL